LLAVAGIYLLTLGNAPLAGEEAAIWRSIDSFAHDRGAGFHGTLPEDLRPYVWHVDDGTGVAVWTADAGPALLAVHWPLAKITPLFTGAVGSQEDRGPGARSQSAQLTTAAVMLALVALVWVVIGQLGVAGAARTAATFAFALATPAFGMHKTTFAEPHTALALLAAFAALGSRASAANWIAGSCLAWAVFVHPATIMVAVAVVAALAIARKPGIVGVAVPPLLALLATCGLTAVRGGGFGLPDIGDDGWFGNPLAALAGLIASPGKSLLLYMPLVLVVPIGWRAWRRHDAPSAMLALWFGGALLALGLCSPDWAGDPANGPRRFFALVPFLSLCVAAAIREGFAAMDESRARLRTAIIALFVAGVAVQWPGVAIAPDTYAGAAARCAPEADRVWSLSHAPLRGQCWLLGHLLTPLPQRTNSALLASAPWASETWPPPGTTDWRALCPEAVAVEWNVHWIVPQPDPLLLAPHAGVRPALLIVSLLPLLLAALLMARARLPRSS
jgi:hypothetical protein